MRPDSLFYLFSLVTRIKGVGPNIAKALGRLLHNDELHIPIVRDLLFHLPTAIIDRSFTAPLISCPADVIATFVVTVNSHQPPPNRYGRRTPYRVYCSNNTGDITLVFFHAHPDYIHQALPVGETRVISGKTEKFEYRLQMTHPDIIAPVSELAEVQKVESLYNLTANLTNRKLSNFIQMALAATVELPEWLEPEQLVQKNWISWKSSLTTAHAPQSERDLAIHTPARERLAYDELLAHQLHLTNLREKNRIPSKHATQGTDKLRKPLIANLPFALTQGQEQALREIDADLASGKRMTRMLQGDVGSGKTIVALLAMLRVVETGGQSALMVPTELIAQQHYQTLSTLCKILGIKIALLTGSVKGTARQEIVEGVASGNIPIVVGTHALFQEKVEFKNLALTVIDEQHRFGVNQRMALSSKGEKPHILHMSATPIPRSLTLTLYGDMDISLLTEKPAGRKPITTRVIPLSRYGEIMEGLQRALSKGEKIYWICPSIEEERDLLDGMESNVEDIAAAEFRYKEFRARFGDTVGMVHGRIKATDREAVMQGFAGDQFNLLVATTVVEVGVDVRDATIIIIEKAERFGLSQLHQLRGRVGRNDKDSSCVLLYSDKAGEISKERLSILRETEDGFHIAEADLKIRGGGDILGTKQSGLPNFTFANLVEHAGLIREAREDAKRILSNDKNLSSQRGKALLLLLELFGYSPSNA